jgi:hypothetical protein
MPPPLSLGSSRFQDAHDRGITALPRMGKGSDTIAVGNIYVGTRSHQ